MQEGRFGACLMAEPELVARCVAAMRARVGVPVTVKCRIGIDDQDSEADLERFIAAIAGAGCRTFIVHARKAWLDGLSPKENREVPPLDYPRVCRLKAAHPELEIVINGGIGSLDEAEAHLAHVDGVALGRAAYQNPYLLAEVDGRLFGDAAPSPRGAPCSSSSSPTPSGMCATAAGSTISRATSSASTMAGRGRAPSAATCPSWRRGRARASRCCSTRSRIAEGDAAAALAAAE